MIKEWIQRPWRFSRVVILGLACIVGGFLGGVIYSDRVYESLQQQEGVQSVGMPEGHPDVMEMMDPELQSLLEKASQVPRDPFLQKKLGDKFAEMGLYERAVGYYEASLKLTGHQPEVWVDCGIMYRNLGQKEKAFQYIQRGLKEDPKLALGWYNLGVVLYHDMNNPKEAKRAWQKYIQMEPTTSQSSSLQVWLESTK